MCTDEQPKTTFITGGWNGSNNKKNSENVIIQLYQGLQSFSLNFRHELKQSKHDL